MKITDQFLHTYIENPPITCSEKKETCREDDCEYFRSLTMRPGGIPFLISSSIIWFTIGQVFIRRMQRANCILQNLEDFSMPTWSSLELWSRPSMSNPSILRMFQHQVLRWFDCYSQLVIGMPIFNVTFCIGLGSEEDQMRSGVHRCFSYAVGKINVTCGTALAIRAALNASDQLALDETFIIRSDWIEEAVVCLPNITETV